MIRPRTTKFSAVTHTGKECFYEVIHIIAFAQMLRAICQRQLIFTRATRSIARYMLWQRGWLAGWLGVCLSHADIVSKRLNLS